MEEMEKQLSPKEKVDILFGVLAGFGIGGVLGILAYYGGWLG